MVFLSLSFTLNTTSFNHIPPRTIPPSSRASPLPPTLTDYGEDHAQEEEDDDDKDDEEKGRRETWGESRVGGLVIGGRGGRGEHGVWISVVGSSSRGGGGSRDSRSISSSGGSRGSSSSRSSNTSNSRTLSISLTLSSSLFFSLFLSFSLSLFLSRSFHLCECVCVSLSFSPPLSLNTPLMCDRSLEYGVWGANRTDGEAPLQLGELWEIHRLQGVHVF